MAVVRSIPRFISAEHYAASFGFQWQIHATTQLDDQQSRESEETFRLKTGLTPEDVRDRLVLDVGCGMGRFSEVVSRWGGRVVSIDLSLAVESAQANLGGRGNVWVAQADAFQLPFQDASFDIVFSMGVLHHTPDCERAVRGLVRLVKPGGILSVWLYGHMGAFVKFSDAYRVVTTRLPQRLLYALCHLAIPLYYLYLIPLVGRPLRTLFPIQMHPRASWRVLDTFDWYSPRYQSKHTYDEVYEWFRTEGFTDIRLLRFPVSVRGRRPGP